MTSVYAANQSDWSAFLNPDAAPVRSRSLAFPRIQNGPLTRTNTSGRFCLLGNGHVSIAAVPGLAIRVRTGTAWITQARDAKDHLVRAGERFVADRAGRLVLSSFQRGEIELEWPAQQRERGIDASRRFAAAAA
jgi:hypothetical protein